MNDVSPLLPGGSAGVPASSAPPAPAAGEPRFQELLEKLQKLAKEQRQQPVDTADDLREALRSAEHGFVAAMDLRRRLEEAFRQHRP